MLSGSKRQDDMKVEQALSNFLDEFFYKRIENGNASLVCKRVNEKNLQQAGIDVIISQRNGDVWLIDEKAALYYRNTMLPTFAFEISSIQRDSGERIPGWFINPDLKTTHYLIIWPNVKCDVKTRQMKELNQTDKDDFTIIEVALIEKKKIIQFLEEQGFSIEKIRNQEKNILEQNLSDRISVGQKDFYFFYSEAIAEKPVNLIIKKEKLLELAIAKYLINSDGASDLAASIALHLN